MSHRIAIKLVSSLVLIAACGDDAQGTQETDSAVTVGPDRRDAATDARASSDARAGNDGAAAADTGARDTGVADAGTGLPDAEVDAGVDAGVVQDAQVPADAETGSTDASLDAAQSEAGSDAALADAGSDAAQQDASVVLPAAAALYTFDEGTGTTAADFTGSFAAADLLNDVTWVAGQHGGAVHLAGGAPNTSSPYVSLPPTLLSACDDVTIALWMKLDATPSWSRLLDLDGAVNGFLYFTATEDVSGTPYLKFDIAHAPEPGAPLSDQLVHAPYPDGTVLVGSWHHVAFTLTAGVGHLYFDGAEIGSNAMNTKPSDIQIGSANTHAWIGRSLFPDPFLDGAIDDFRVSCTAYSADQIAALAR